MVGRSNKIFQSSFGLVMQHFFRPLKQATQEMRSDFFVKKNHFLLSSQAKKLALSPFAKNGPKTQL